MDVLVFIWYGCLGGVYWGRRCCFGDLFPCSRDFDVVVCGGVLTCMLIVVFRTFCSSRGVRKFIVGLIWLCMHIIEVRDGSTYL